MSSALNIQINLLIHTGIDKSTSVYKSVQENNATVMKESPGDWIWRMQLGRVLLKTQPMSDEQLFHNIPISPRPCASLLSLCWCVCVCARIVTRKFVHFVDATRRNTSTWGRESGETPCLHPCSPPRNPAFSTTLCRMEARDATAGELAVSTVRYYCF